MTTSTMITPSQQDLSIGRLLGFYAEQLMGKTPEQLAEMFSPRLKALGLGSNATTVEVADAARGSGGATNRLLAPFLNQTLNTSPAQVGQLETGKPAFSAADQLALFNQDSQTPSFGPSPNNMGSPGGSAPSNLPNFAAMFSQNPTLDNYRDLEKKLNALGGQLRTGNAPFSSAALQSAATALNTAIQPYAQQFQAADNQGVLNNRAQAAQQRIPSPLDQVAPPIGASTSTRAPLVNNAGLFGTSGQGFFGPGSLPAMGSISMGNTFGSPMGSTMGGFSGMSQPTGGAIGNAFPSVTGYGGGGQGMALEGKYGLSAGNSSPFPIRGDLSVVKMAQGGEASKWSEQQLADAGKFIASNIDNPAEIERVRAHIEKATGMDISAGDLINAASRSGVTLAAPTAGVLSGDVAPSTWTQQNLIDAGNFIAQNIDNPAAIEAARANVEQATGQNISSLDLLRAAQSAQQPAQLSRAMADVLSGDVYGGMTARQAYDWITKGVIDQPQLSAQTAQNVMRNLGISSRDLAQAALLDPRISAGAQYALVSNPLYQQGQQTGLAALNANINNFIANALQYQTPAQARQSLQNALQSGVLTAGRALNEYDVQRATGKSLNDLFKTAVQGPQVLGPLKALPDLTGSYVPPTAPPPEAPPSALTPGQEGLDPGTAIVGNIPTSAQVRIPQLDAEFRASAPRTPVYDRLGRVTGYEYTPAAKLAPATGTTVFNWTPPGVTSRPRQLLSRQDVPGATFDPVTGEAQMPLSASQRFARDRAQLDRDFRQMYAAQAAQDSSLPAQAPASAAQAFRELALSDPETAMQLKLRDIEQQRFDPAKADMAVRARYGAQPAQAAVSSLFAPFINRNMATLQGLAKLQNPVTYSQRRPDVAAAYAALSPEKKKEFPTLLDYEVYHYNTFGKNEDPTLPNPLEQVGELQSPYSTAFFSKGGEASTEDFIKKQSGGDVSRGTLPPVRLADGSPNPDEVPSVIDERDEIRSESQRMLNRLASQSKLPPGLQRTIQGARARQGESLIPAAVPARDVMAGMFGAQAMNPGSEAYRTGQALANSPPVEVLKAPAKIASAAGDAATALASLGGAGVIKSKGGNWFKDLDSVEYQLNALLKNAGARNLPADQVLAEMNATYTPEAMARLSPESLAQVERAYAELKPAAAINKWVNTKLTKYVKNEMGTPEDPVRALAERGVLHIPIYDLDIMGLTSKRERAGMPMAPQGQSEAARFWEQMSDKVIDFTTPSRIKKQAKQGAWEHQRNENTQLLRENPWIKDASADTKIYRPSISEDLVDSAGFGHLVDELTNAMSPQSGLPDSLRIQPKDLEKITVPQAVEKVAKINDWRAAQKAEADALRARNPATFEHRAYETIPGTTEPNQKGLRWVELAPKQSSPGIVQNERGTWDLIDNTGHNTGSFKSKEGAERAMAQFAKNDERFKKGVTPESRAALEDALKYEGETMGHCVGGYCPDVIEGRSRIYSLRDKKGEPHVTIEVTPQGYVFSDVINAVGLEKANAMFDAGLDLKDMVKEVGLPPKLGIEQIKGKANKAPKDEYLPFVQDFVRSGNWSEVKDLLNANLIAIDRGSDLAAAMKAENATIPKYVTQEEFTELLRKYKPYRYKHGGPVDKTTAFIKAHA